MSDMVRRGQGQPQSLAEAFDRLYRETFLSPWLTTFGEGQGVFMIDMYETPNDYVVKASTPGMKPEDIQVNIDNNVLTLRGEIKQEQKEENAQYHHMERRYGKFERSVVLPGRVNVNNVQATLKDGVLTVTIPKAEEAKPKKINVQVQQ